ncbi:hypothetical protein BOTBODRAFT_37228 [Botryobasidium botryosum FD-172 SS1]|uniref:Uncharacterized protein n=1 Tax=Botryobasidium botryosum (strain FD-172 SS1) TaxID=930990 RepID=A0A067M3R8_BOTB1|nr:hypothetical protein BOTBODRAFT_37228 [Botryobasidium botryosum FD-172 SS1]
MPSIPTFVEQDWEKDAKIVVSLDIGTTQSAVSFAHLYPGCPQTIQRVLQWPGQEAHSGVSKIPTIVWYDSAGQARAFGAEARMSSVEVKAEDEHWQLAEHFKLHLHPDTMRAEYNITVNPLPFNLTLEEIYADFMAYLLRHTENYFSDCVVDGRNIWDQLRPTMEFVIAHPNGWGVPEQAFLRNAAISADLIPSAAAARERIHFVSEAEASAHFVIFHAQLQSHLSIGTEVAICDAGGSTVDTTVYKVDAVKPVLRLKEKQASACVQAGGIFVNQTAADYFTRTFRAAGLTDDEIESYVADALLSFEYDAKKAFKDTAEERDISIGGSRFTDRRIGVRRGSLSISGVRLETFFAPWTSKIVDSVKSQLYGHSVKHLLLVGGFGESKYLRQKLAKNAGALGVEVTLISESTSKAVADGGVIWFAKHAVSARATRYAFGLEVVGRAKSTDIQEKGRIQMHTPTGVKVPGVWSEIVPKNAVFHESEEVTKEFARFYSTKHPDLSCFRTVVFAFDGDTQKSKPRYLSDEMSNLFPGFHEVCKVTANLAGLRDSLHEVRGPEGVVWLIKFKIALTFGATELRASILWQDKLGNVHRGAASVLPSNFA